VSSNLDRACARYAGSLVLGRNSLSAGLTVSQQTALYRAGLKLDRALLGMVKPVLVEVGLEQKLWKFYFTFARRLARICRKYGSRTQANEAQALRSVWLGHGLDPAILDRIMDVLALERPA